MVHGFYNSMGLILDGMSELTTKSFAKQKRLIGRTRARMSDVGGEGGGARPQAELGWGCHA